MVTFNDICLKLIQGNDIVMHFSFVLNNGDKLAVIGEEGSGKSTLMKALYDHKLVDSYCYMSGNISLNNHEIYYIPQQIDSQYLALTAIDYLLLNPHDNQPDYGLYQRYYEIEQLFSRFQLSHDLLENHQPLASLSGGEKIKLQMIKCLLYPAKLYLFDEPTNDLDLDTISLFEQIFKEITAPIMLISHDETLLKNIATSILHLEQVKRDGLGKFRYENVDYSNYVTQRNREIERFNREAYRSQKEYREREQILMHQHLLVENDLDRASGNQPSQGRILAKKMKNIKSQEKKLKAMEVLDYYKKEEGMNLFFSRSVNIHSRKVVLDLYLPKLCIGERVLANDIALKIVGPEHVFISGNNGSGKTTLVKIILETLKKHSTLGVGYMPQQYDEQFNTSTSAIDYLQSKLGYDKEVKIKIMNHLAALGFLHREMVSDISTLSGGLKAKLYLLEMVMGDYDILILDEPTRNISPLSSPVIRSILHDFPGVLIVISHDRSLIKEVSTTHYFLQKTGLVNK